MKQRFLKRKKKFKKKQEEESDEIEVAEVNEELPILRQGEIPADNLFSNNISQISPSGSFNNQVSSIGGSVSSGLSTPKYLVLEPVVFYLLLQILVL